MSNQSGRFRVAFCLLAAITLSIAPAAAQTTFTVTSLADDGPGTLRAQIAASDQIVGATINFSVSGTIHLASTLALHSGRRNGLTIDGGNQIVISGGGAVRVFDVPSLLLVTFTNLTIADGASTAGGGVRNSGELTLKNVLFRSNTANNGGAIIGMDGSVTVDSCAFDGNSATSTNTADTTSGGGGAIASLISSRVFVVNSTFANNRAVRGGAFLNDAEEGNFYNSTISGNTATVAGGGLFLGRFSYSGGNIDLKNTIVANNSGGNCATVETAPHWGDLGGNISYPDNTCRGAVADPKLAPLTNNGGPTPTMALLAGSAAIDHVTDCTYNGQPLTVDQRGFPRPQGPACDSGAYEKSAFAFTAFQPPIANPPQVNSPEAGRAIPITFGLGGFQGMNILAAGYPASQPISCSSGDPSGPLVSISTPGRSGLSYDSVHKLYTIVWKTSESWENRCRKLILRLTDGVDHPALFRFRD